MPIVYLTTNKINNKKYIGVDSKNNQDYFGSGVAIKLALEKYGKINFEKEIIEEYDNIEYIYDREKYWIDFYDAINSKEFYNIHIGGKGGFVLNEEQIQKSKEKVIERNKERKGKTYEDLYGEKSNIEKEKRKIGSTNKKKSEETKKKLSFSNKGHTPWNKGLNKDNDERVKKNCIKTKQYYKIYTLSTDDLTIDFIGRKSLEEYIKLENEKLSFKNRINVVKLIKEGMDKNYQILKKITEIYDKN